MIVFSFLEECGFSGKVIVPFCTHEGSKLGRSVRDIARLCPDSTILKAIAIRGTEARSLETEQMIDTWLRDLNIDGGVLP
ncbi:Flavodoxin [Thermodesulforhabdus norvegica]|uniref:Flavodoxin n=1 Tax=Thermodesulforhabdus norvegica TaxID=39841 RepID=A0A1I4S7A4_9BACT|nr:Flavodoxin [Thermodesulforhabdus norvegica]